MRGGAEVESKDRLGCEPALLVMLILQLVSKLCAVTHVAGACVMATRAASTCSKALSRDSTAASGGRGGCLCRSCIHFKNRTSPADVTELAMRVECKGEAKDKWCKGEGMRSIPHYRGQIRTVQNASE
jgi:hypothetical protein